MTEEGRYDRQERLPQVGVAGQAVLARSRVALVGLGALGSVCSDLLARAGVGYLRLIDGDTVEWTNLQRVALYDEEDVRNARPKACAAAVHLASINSEIQLEPHAVFLSEENCRELLGEVDLILDGSDNLKARYLINQTAFALGTPWIYTGVLETHGMVMPVTLEGPCFNCLSPCPQDSEDLSSRVTAGILPSTTRLAATLQATLALKMLLGKADLPTTQAPVARLLSVDTWEQEIESILVEKDPHCPVCSATDIV